MFFHKSIILSFKGDDLPSKGSSYMYIAVMFIEDKASKVQAVVYTCK